MYKTIIEMLKALEKTNDIIYREYNNVIRLDFNDFDGFDDEWCEIDREYENAKGVDDLVNYLNENAKKIDRDFFTTYDFDGFSVKVGYTSYDI